jgi:hypothetical protein
MHPCPPNLPLKRRDVIHRAHALGIHFRHPGRVRRSQTFASPLYQRVGKCLLVFQLIQQHTHALAVTRCLVYSSNRRAWRILRQARTGGGRSQP